MTDDSGRRRKTERSGQLVLDLTRDPSYAREEFLVSPSNEGAYAAVERWPAWPSRVLLLVGSPGSGKSHLASIWAAKSRARIVAVGHGTRLEDWGGPIIALVEDWDRASYDQASLFHLINMVGETGGSLLLTSRSVPTASNIAVPDLLSRLRLAESVELHSPDPQLIKAIIVKLFADRQIYIDDDIISYTALHCERSIEAINGFVAAVDEEALASGRRVTRALAARIMTQLTSYPISTCE